MKSQSHIQLYSVVWRVAAGGGRGAGGSRPNTRSNTAGHASTVGMFSQGEAVAGQLAAADEAFRTEHHELFGVFPATATVYQMD